MAVQQVKMDMKNFILPFMDDNMKECVIYIPQPNQQELVSISAILGFLYPKIQNKELEFMVFVKDWQVMIDRKFKNDSDKEEIQGQLKAFLERKINVGNAFYMDGTAKGELTEDEREFIGGELLFFSSLFRYVKMAFKQNEMRDLTTHLTSLEYQESLKKLHAERLASAAKKPSPSK